MLQRRTLRASHIFIALVVLVHAGCASDEVNIVNTAVKTRRISPTDALSRRLAKETLDGIREQEEDYRVGTDDVLSVSIFEWMVRDEPMTIDPRISESGIITLPLLGTIEAKNKTVEEIEQDIVSRLIAGGLIKTPRVSVVVKEFRSKTIAVIGALEAPGRFNLRQNVTTLLDAIALAGGLDERAGYVLYVLRPRHADKKAADEGAADPALDTGAGAGLAGPLVSDTKKEVIVVDLVELLERGDMELNVVLRDDDVVFVPEAPLFYVMGFVRKPGGFALKRPTTVLDGVALAEGLMEYEASPRSCVLKRRLADEEVVIPLDLVAISSGQEPNIFLKSNDIIDVRQTTSKKIFIETLDFFKRLFHVGYNVDLAN